MKIESLLQNVYAINKKYENIAAVTGESFNIFKILKMETKEVNTHSAFIAELLNPAGSHGQKDVFLKLFIRCFNIPGFNDINDNQTEVIVEQVLDNGRLDIVIKSKNARDIVIENKIYAGDMDKQLVRYKKCCPGCHLIYLTLYGIEPSDASITDEFAEEKLVKNKDFNTKSYKEDVLNWLILCRKEATAHPILRETLTQYINLIKHLTNQTMNEQTKEEIISIILKDPENIASAENIVEVWTDTKFRIIEKLKKKIISESSIQNKLGLFVKVDRNFDKLGQKGSGFYFYKENWKYCICFYFGKELDQLVVGVSHLEDYSKDVVLEKDLSDNLSLIGKNTSYPGWAWVADYDIWYSINWKNMIDVLPSEISKTLESIIKILDVKGISL